jgi:hypothetical protein
VLYKISYLSCAGSQAITLCVLASRAEDDSESVRGVLCAVLQDVDISRKMTKVLRKWLVKYASSVVDQPYLAIYGEMGNR